MSDTENKPIKTSYYARNRESVLKKNKIYRDANKVEIAAKRKIYVEANREKINEAKKIYCEANKEELAKKKKIYCEANKEAISERRKIHYQANKERLILKSNLYREANKDKIKAHRVANRDKIRAKANQKTTCECGMVCVKSRINDHKSRKIHTRNMNELNLYGRHLTTTERRLRDGSKKQKLLVHLDVKSASAI
tara:strand:- start:121 stop:705 length:585 start_codon:yes stop_codon:yes gene_type:complete